MTENSTRPFYAEYAWAFDLLVDRPVRKECTTIAAWLVERRVLPGSEVLDAGCGTGRYASELARRGYIVHGIDVSTELVEVARRSIDEAPVSVSFAVGNIFDQPAGRFDAILCRGVLNDFVDHDSRAAVFATFARAIRPAGVLILDVREWEASAVRKDREPLFKKSVDTDRGKLTFTSITEVDRQNRQGAAIARERGHRPELRAGIAAAAEEAVQIIVVAGQDQIAARHRRACETQRQRAHATQQCVLAH